MPSKKNYEEYDFEPSSIWEGSWRGEKICHYCGEPIEVGNRVRYRGGSPYDRGLRHVKCASEEVLNLIDEDES